ncbi:MAG: Dam family site-specific DNA-(adenine-N6)-methyltransferase [Fibromonadaceae bacterium]|jgi:DNA adenine methylase|nr:Dam family site-specific DNA-(adenine-N6)-methyltransferase [Fibromonadaceae bacterium]
MVRSPLFYVGDKYKIINEIKYYFPKNIDRFIEPFVGGGSVYLNVNAKEYLLNDIDNYVIGLHNFLSSYIGKENDFFKLIFSIIRKYKLSLSYEKDTIPSELKQKYKKTYFAHFNKESFGNLKNHYNNSTKRNFAELYVLLIYSFNRMLRFNSKGDYNVPVGNVDFNGNVYDALINYFRVNETKKTVKLNKDFEIFFNELDYSKNDFIYLDPPYLITFSEYNKLWNEQTEKKLLQKLDSLNSKNVKFAISNVIDYKGKKNLIFSKWSKKYNTYNIKSNYISFRDNSIKKFTEILVTNYEKS